MHISHHIRHAHAMHNGTGGSVSRSLCASLFATVSPSLPYLCSSPSGFPGRRHTHKRVDGWVAWRSPRGFQNAGRGLARNPDSHVLVLVTLGWGRSRALEPPVDCIDLMDRAWDFRRAWDFCRAWSFCLLPHSVVFRASWPNVVFCRAPRPCAVSWIDTARYVPGNQGEASGPNNFFSMSALGVTCKAARGVRADS